jgi:hypothetical protein
MHDPQTPSSAPVEPPVTATERLVAGFWQELLEVEAVGREQTFVALGGNSLLATMLANRLESALGHRPTLSEMFSLNLGDLARLLDEAAREPAHEAW